MKRAWIMLAAVAAILSSPALAFADDTSNSSSNSGAVSGSSSTAVTAPVNNGNSSSASNSGSVSGSSSSSRGGSAAATNAGNSQSAATTVNNNYSTPATQTIRSAPALVAPALTTTLTETCMGSTSLGVSVVGVGATAGTTWNDNECVRRLNARELNSMGFHTEACYVLRVDKDVENAFNRSGNRCENWISANGASGGSTPNPHWGSASADSPPPAQPATSPPGQ